MFSLVHGKAQYVTRALLICLHEVHLRVSDRSFIRTPKLGSDEHRSRFIYEAKSLIRQSD